MNDYQRIELILRHMTANFHEQPSLEELAKKVDLSDAHFHRLFRRFAGTTPKTYLQFLTAKHAKRLLEESRDTLNASLEVGLSGPSRLHDLMIDVVAFTPGEVRKKGAGVEIRHGFHQTLFGECLLAATDRGICHLSFVLSNKHDEALRELRAHWPEASLVHDRRSTRELVERVFNSAKSSGRSSGNLSLVLRGSEFQIKVWEALLKIPPGHVLSYSDVARAIGAPKASRAVGSAIAKNSVGYVIPCHRVIRESGHFGQYRWDEVRKLMILSHEFTLRKSELTTASDATCED